MSRSTRASDKRKANPPTNRVQAVKSRRALTERFRQWKKALDAHVAAGNSRNSFTAEWDALGFSKQDLLQGKLRRAASIAKYWRDIGY